MTDRDTCAATSRLYGEPPLGTASRARRWVLLEQPGPWGVDAIVESRLPAEVADELHRLSTSLPCRVLLLRRTGRTSDSTGPRHLFVGVTRPDGTGWLEQFLLEGPTDLLGLDLSGLSSGRSVGGARREQPLYLVCTNGRHDPCCAEYGLPVARALSDGLGEAVWECSHVGGDRFAGNLVCLPEGVFYGHLDPVSAWQAVEAHQRGRLLLDKLRGRSALSFPAQAAEILIRRALDDDRLEALRLTDHRHDGAGGHRLSFELRDGRTAVATLLVRRDVASVRVLTCATDPVRPPSFELADLEVRPGPPAP